MANGYHQVIDGSKVCTIAYSFTGGSKILFEAYGSGKTLSIPVGSSITIRPKVSILAMEHYTLPANTFYVGVNAITYDSGVSK